MDRRIFIKLSAFSATAIALSITHGCKPQTFQKVLATPDLLSRLQEKDVLTEIGKTYASTSPEEHNVDKLISLLLDDDKITESADASAIISFLNNNITADFKAGKTVIVNGWVLSVTEARQCALFYLIQN
jgi:hypothetical protein